MSWNFCQRTPGGRAELTWFWVGRISGGVRASSSALYGFCVGLVLSHQYISGILGWLPGAEMGWEDNGGVGTTHE